MIQRTVIYSADAVGDLQNVYDWFAGHSGGTAANLYVERVQEKCNRLAVGSNRGTLLSEIAPNVRKTGIIGRLAVVFNVQDDAVFILRIFMAGRDWESVIGAEVTE